MLIPIDQICADGVTRVRVKTSDLACQDYADAMEAGAVFPPLVVFFNGENYWLADGFHRLEAYRSRATVEVECEVYEGTSRDALLFALGSNAAHGLPRTIEDKRRAVFLVLEDDEWGAMSDRWIAEHCTVSHPFVSKMRALLAATERDEELPIEREDLIADSESVSLRAAAMDGSTGNVSSWRAGAGAGSTGNVSSCGRVEPSGEEATPANEPPKRIGKDGRSRRAPSAELLREDQPKSERRNNPPEPPDLLIAIRVATANSFASATAEQINAFVSLSAELQLGVLAIVVAGGSLGDAIERVFGSSEQVDREPPTETAPQARAVEAPTVDVSGRVVPERVRGALAEFPRIKSLVNDLRRVRARWKALLDEYNAQGRKEMWPVVYESTHLEHQWKRLESSFALSLLPHAVCGYCKGIEEKCPACKGAGWLTKSKHQSVPDKVRCSPLGAGAMGWWINQETKWEAKP